MTNYPILLALQAARRLGGLCRHCTETHWFGCCKMGAFVGWVPETTVHELIAFGFLTWSDGHTRVLLTPEGTDYLNQHYPLEPPCPSQPPTPAPSELPPPSPSTETDIPSRTC